MTLKPLRHYHNPERPAANSKGGVNMFKRLPTDQLVGEPVTSPRVPHAESIDSSALISASPTTTPTGTGNTVPPFLN